MKDQVCTLKERSIPATYTGSSQSDPHMIDKIRNKDFKIVYTTPENFLAVVVAHPICSISIHILMSLIHIENTKLKLGVYMSHQPFYCCTVMHKVHCTSMLNKSFFLHIFVIWKPHFKAHLLKLLLVMHMYCVSHMQEFFSENKFGGGANRVF